MGFFNSKKEEIKPEVTKAFLLGNYKNLARLVSHFDSQLKDENLCYIKKTTIEVNKQKALKLAAETMEQLQALDNVQNVQIDEVLILKDKHEEALDAHFYLTANL